MKQSNVCQSLDDIAKELKNPARVEKVGIMASDMIRNHIYEGKGFAPLSQVTVAYRNKGKPLQDTGSLRDSITSQVLSENCVSVGTNNKSASLHNFGGVITAKKEWLFIPASGTRRLERKFGKSPTSVITGLKSLKAYVYRVGRTVCYKKKEMIKGKVLYYLKKSVEIPKREFFYLTESEKDTIFREITNDVL
ncbi:MAG: phage virion morphogenesis protein [Treponemataceae bacterium]